MKIGLRDQSMEPHCGMKHAASDFGGKDGFGCGPFVCC